MQILNRQAIRMRKDFCYVFSSELNVPLRIRLVSLSGYLPNNGNLQRFAIPSGCMFVRMMIYCNGREVGASVQSSFRQHLKSAGATSNRDIQKFDEWITLPVCYSELSRDAILHVTVWEVGNSINPVLVAQCAKQLFSKHSIFRTGLMDLRLEYIQGCSKKTNINQEQITFQCNKQSLQQADQSDEDEADVSTPLLQRPSNVLLKQTNSKGIQLPELLKKEKLYNQKFIDRVDWLDQITFAKLEEIKQEAKIGDRSLFLTVEFPTVQHSDDMAAYSIIFFAGDAPLENEEKKELSDSESDIDPLIPPQMASRKMDPELDMENLCEIKHHMMTRNARAMDIDRRLQPNPAIRDSLESIIKSASCQSMLMEERDLIWKFRFWLKSNPKALTKFVRSVNWQEKLEVRQAIQVILEWEPIDACDALELLSPDFTHYFIRRYAVSRLQSTTFANILLFLPQLVQALRYEPTQQDLAASTDEDILIVNQTGNADAEIASSRHISSTTSDVQTDLFDGQESMDLATFLIKIACQSNTIANFLFWYLKVEVQANCQNKPISEMYLSVITKLKQSLSSGNITTRQTLATIAAQIKFVDSLVDISKIVSEHGGNRSKKLEVLKRKLMENNELMDLNGLSLPLDPSVHVKAVQPESTVLFSSNLMPMRLTFSTVRGNFTPFECAEAYTTIFKRGDDLRQDQLVLQMIRLMDSLLKEDKLDLCLTPYAVLATSCSEGFVQFIRGATPLADIKNIQDTLRTFRPSSSAPYGIEADVLNNYVKSCAGYSIICYILGIGDRHLHNLLLCENGKMFHVDFGFILGRDPKPMPPPMKLTSEMINAMGGQNSEHFRAFVNYCTIAFCILRRHANLITNLFSLMLDAGIPDIAIERDKAVLKILERFHIQLSDEAACQLIVRLIESSLSAKMPLIVDFVHNFRQYISN